jgi:hypothetical protein
MNCGRWAGSGSASPQTHVNPLRGSSAVYGRRSKLTHKPKRIVRSFVDASNSNPCTDYIVIDIICCEQYNFNTLHQPVRKCIQ